MTTKDHNETLVGIHLLFGSIFTLGLVASPWIIAQNFRDRERIPLAVMIFGFVFMVAVLMFSTAIAMRKKKPIARKLAVYSAAMLIFIFWPTAIYTWWFMHSDGARHLYSGKDVTSRSST